MIDRTAFLSDAQKVVARLEKDLRARCDDMPEVGRAVEAEYRKAKAAGRTGQTLEEWRADAVTQQAVAWVLSCVFARFLEDNALVDPPKLAGPGDRLGRARDEHELHFRSRPHDTDREYLLAVFDDLAKRPGTKDLYGQHNPIRAVPNWLSPDAAKDVLLPFFQKIDAGSGALVHDFTDPSIDTRFLGDLYQDLSEAARKKYALLQTPVFVEEFILDRTLVPAVETFGLDKVRMIDPACGSGHFLLGGFHRLLDLWRKKEPGTPRRELVRRALAAVHGVDLNPYAAAIARFRLLLAAWQAAGVTSLKNAPDFRLNLACGDSLLHGGSWSQTLPGMGHHYQPEDAGELERLLRPGTYHAVVANPPYITPKDRSLNEQYRERYSACYRQYSLSVPFMQRIFNLACDGGFTGQITANSFMKREFGKRLIEEFFPRVDLTHVIDTSGAYIPGRGTPTVILLGRNRKPVASTIRTVMGIRGEPTTPDDPSQGKVWTAIVEQFDQPGSQSVFVSVADSPRDNFHKHPWSIGGGGAAELKAQLDKTSGKTLADVGVDVGVIAVSRENEVFVVSSAVAKRRGVPASERKDQITGDQVRDWAFTSRIGAIWPYDPATLEGSASGGTVRSLWPWRVQLSERVAFGVTQIQRGLSWYQYSMFFGDRYRARVSIAFPLVATHNHFVLSDGGIVFNHSAPVIQLLSGAEDDPHSLLGLLNSSTACFWMHQTFHNKGAGGGTRVASGKSPLGDESYESHFEHDATKLKLLPIPTAQPRPKLASRLDAIARELGESTPDAILKDWARGHDLEQLLADAERKSARLRGTMIRLQEDLDWECYRLYGLTTDDLADPQWETRDLPVKLGERAFEIVLARKMRDEGLETTWFERHRSTPVTEPPAHWPAHYRELVERRIAAIAANPQIALIEQPEYKRRWNDTPWADKVAAALHDWLHARLESYFDLDGRMNDRGRPTAKIDLSLVNTAKIADVASKDAEFREVGRLYREGRIDFDVTKLATELVGAESVPLLPVLRYKPTGMDKRRAWERTWELQRREDAVDARVVGKGTELGADGWTPQTDDGNSPLNPAQAKLLKQYLVDPDYPQPIPVPPKYKSADFQKADYWRLRGGLDVPKERWVSFPHCEGADGLPLVAWAGYRIEQCDSPLAARIALLEDESEATVTVLVTGLPDHELGEDVLVRLAGRRLYPLDPWQIVKELFQAHAVDPRLRAHGWIADLPACQRRFDAWRGGVQRRAAARGARAGRPGQPVPAERAGVPGGAAGPGVPPVRRRPHGRVGRDGQLPGAALAGGEGAPGPAGGHPGDGGRGVGRVFRGAPPCLPRRPGPQSRHLNP